jgi:hypothetical protein
LPSIWPTQLASRAARIDENTAPVASPAIGPAASRASQTEAASTTRLDATTVSRATTISGPNNATAGANSQSESGPCEA